MSTKYHYGNGHGRFAILFWPALAMVVALSVVAGVLYIQKEGTLAEPVAPAVPAAREPLPSPPSVVESATPNSTIPVAATTKINKPAPNPTPKPAHAVGISVAAHLAGLSSAQLDKELSDIASVGGSWIRIDIDWSTVQQRSASESDWSIYDRIIAAASAHGIHVLPILLDTPAWARPSGCDSGKCAPQDPDTYAAFAAAAAARYSKQGVHAWEIWNEPNMSGSWQPEANPEQYARMLKAAYGAIKRQDPNATVITGGLASIGTGGGNIAQLQFLSSLYANGAGGFFDAVGIHPYSFPALPSYSASWSAWQKMFATAPSVRSIMAANGDSGKKIWITEYGAPTNGPGTAATLQNYRTAAGTDHVTEELQAAMVTDAIKDAAQYSWAGPLFWYSYKDLGDSTDTTENFYGLLRHDGSAKSAYDAFKSAL